MANETDMAEGKWISELDPAMSVAEAAGRVLQVRLSVVPAARGPALHEADRDAEHVHHLRVATRRAGAALRIFRSCLPEKVFRRVRRQLRRLRRAAGAARDWDVFLLTLADRWKPSRTPGGADFLLGYALGHRAAAQEQLLASAGTVVELERSFAHAVAAVRAPNDGPDSGRLNDLAQSLLRELLGEVNAAMQGDLASHEHLHQVRILGKRLRYAMEVFVSCFPPAFRERSYPAVEEMQEILGRANDSQVAAQRLIALRHRLRTYRRADWMRVKPAVESLLRYHQRRLPQERERFLRWRQEWQQAGSATDFAALLGSSGALTQIASETNGP